jgi:branched-chain amino acid transport system permease protein
VLAAVSETVQYRRELSRQRLARIVLLDLLVPAVLAGLVLLIAPLKPAPIWSGLIAVALITPMGPMIYRAAVEPIATSSVLVLLIAAFGVHFSLNGLGLLFFGPEGVGITPLFPQSYELGPLLVSGQSVTVLAVTALLLVLFALFFRFSLYGKALRACASNRIGARLSGIPTERAGRLAFAIAALLGAVSGVLIGPLMTVYYDSGFLIGLKGFVAAILGGLVSYPLTVLAALAVGFSEALFSFWASAFKEVLVFSLIIPVLMVRSLVAAPGGGHN